jgi:non-ribosomal peptide synthetase component E (peptide arylation enzyme)
VADVRIGKRNCLSVIPRAGASLFLVKVFDFLREGSITYKLAEEIEVFDDFAFTPTGELQRHVLTRQVLDWRRIPI